MKMSSELYLGPSIGDEYKIHVAAKGNAGAGIGMGISVGGELNESSFGIDLSLTSTTLGFNASSSVGLKFGPYKILSSSYSKDLSGGISLGLFNGDFTTGKDGGGFYIGLGPGFGGTIKSTAIGDLGGNISASESLYKVKFEKESKDVK
ncbi:hypothetical protein B4900_03145 [Yersinia rohdei]|nr:hypothetical protein B4900_03145 [Yersinia rohdei]